MLPRINLLGSAALLSGAALLLSLSGCTESLETGYKPHALKDSSTIRRSYYASPFTPEAKAPQLERDQEFEQRRPKPGY